ncbi:NAD(P)H-hydrate dehydratase [bacterium]|nr:NAD(P)H-hydrate dehydratase [bacterium]
MNEAFQVLDVVSMRRVDEETIANDLPLLALMENAGRSAWESYEEMWGGAPLHILVGPGHNGADGIVMARWAAIHGVSATLYGNRERLGEAGKTQWALAKKEGVLWSRDEPKSLGDPYGVVVDGLLGTGAKGQPRGDACRWIEGANRAPWLGRMALDAPSGVDMDTGHVEGVAFQADLTLTFAFLKPGLLLAPGAHFAGIVEVAYIGIPKLGVGTPFGWYHTPESIASLLPSFPSDGHKGTAGRVGVWAGSRTFPGAARLTVEGALRSGAGVVHWSGQGEMPPEVIQEGALPSAIRPLDGWAIGPGLGRQEESLASIRDESSLLECPVVLDADGLTAFVGHEELLTSHKGERILTPHHAEGASLLCGDICQIERDRLGGVRALARRTGATVLLKGQPTLVAQGDLPIHFVGSGCPSLAHGGTGDVLAGLIAGLLAQGLPGLDAAICGAWLHGRAGSLWEEEGRPRESATASEIAPLIESAWKDLPR